MDHIGGKPQRKGFISKLINKLKKEKKPRKVPTYTLTE